MLGHDLVDIHAHFFTDDYRAAMRSAGLRNVDGFPIPDWSVESALDYTMPAKVCGRLSS
jgi:hypothetical protein